MQPIIGITMCIDENVLIRRNANHNYVREEYSAAVRAAGGQPIFIDPEIDPLVAAKLCDGIVLSGGEDIDPRLYGQERQTLPSDPQEPRKRTDWERELIDACDEWQRPILGICYGSQLLNVHYGGTIDQDVMRHEGAVDHGASEQASMHEIVFEKDFLGYMAGERVAVTARHHQAVDRLAPGFSVVARAADGCVEAITGNGHVGVQWHSECDDTAPQVYGKFVELCKQRQHVAPVAHAEAAHPLSKLLSRITKR